MHPGTCNSAQVAAFKMMKVTGMICSRHSTSVQEGRRFFCPGQGDREVPQRWKQEGESAESVYPARSAQLVVATVSFNLVVLEEDRGSSHNVSAVNCHSELPIREVEK